MPNERSHSREHGQAGRDASLLPAVPWMEISTRALRSRSLLACQKDISRIWKGWMCKNPGEVAKSTTPEFPHGRKQTHLRNVAGWVSRQAWRAAVCPELQMIWSAFKPDSEAQSPPSLPAHPKGKWSGLGPGLTLQGPGRCTSLFWSAKQEEATARPHQQMARWPGNIRAVMRQGWCDSR